MVSEAFKSLPQPQALAPAVSGGGKGGVGVGAAGSTGSCGKTIYRATGAPRSGGAGSNQGIHYSSTGQSATSHRVDISGVGGQTALEATVYLTMQTGCGGGHDELTIKFYGPSHTDKNCCYCLHAINPRGQVGFGEEGIHPHTNTFAHAVTNVGSLGGKRVGFKAVIWKSGTTIHQENWLDTGGSWRKVNEYNRTDCGKDKKSTGPVANAEVEFRIDCSSAVFACTSVVPISPGARAAYAQVKSYAASRAYEVGVPIDQWDPDSVYASYLTVPGKDDCGELDFNLATPEYHIGVSNVH